MKIEGGGRARRARRDSSHHEEPRGVVSTSAGDISHARVSTGRRRARAASVCVDVMSTTCCFLVSLFSVNRCPLFFTLPPFLHTEIVCIPYVLVWETSRTTVIETEECPPWNTCTGTRNFAMRRPLFFFILRIHTSCDQMVYRTWPRAMKLRVQYCICSGTCRAIVITRGGNFAPCTPKGTSKVLRHKEGRSSRDHTIHRKA